MGLFEQFPYTNFHGVNLKWILDRMVEFETRLTTAEGKISSLEDRMDTAESDIDTLEDRMDTAEDDIDALEGRVDTAEDDIDKLQADVGDVTLLHTTDKSSLVAAVNENEGRLDAAEGDIDALETQMPKSLAGDAGKVLTATGAGAASWQDVPKELPVYSALASPNTLGIKGDGTLGWLHFSAIVPDMTGKSGDVLTVNSYENMPEWSTPVDNSPLYVELGDTTMTPSEIEALIPTRPVYLKYSNMFGNAIYIPLRDNTFGDLHWRDQYGDTAAYWTGAVAPFSIEYGSHGWRFANLS